MKKLFLVVLALCSVTSFAQPGKKGKEAKMAPSYSPGYYLNLKGDTVKGEVVTNLEEEPMYYITIFFKLKGAAKPTEITTKKAKGYGYDNTHFTMLKMGENDVYLKYLERGRLALMEYRFLGSENGKPKMISIYFLQDTQAPADDKFETNIVTQLPDKNHKKAMKNFFRDQPILLEQVDKWYFKIDEIRKAVQEFNAMYPVQ